MPFRHSPSIVVQKHILIKIKHNVLIFFTLIIVIDTQTLL